MPTTILKIKCPNCGGEVSVRSNERKGTPHICPSCGHFVYNDSKPEHNAKPKLDAAKEAVNAEINDPNLNKTYNPNVYAALSVVFCLFLPWIIGYPFGVIGDNRAKLLGDTTGHRMALVGKIVSIVMMAIYGLGLIISMWTMVWWWGLISLFGVLIVYSLYFGIAYYFHKH